LIFFNTHDPTTLNQQGNDIGTQYRSGIYFTEAEQQSVSLTIIKQLDAEGVFNSPIVTEVKEATTFYKADEDHVNYYNENKTQPYCTFIIDPKIEKLKNYFTNYITTIDE
jgi:peptide-methionine (S)-S-oxide reductase